MQQDGSDQYQEDSSNNQFLQTQNETMKRDDTCKPYYLTSESSDTNCISKQFIYKHHTFFFLDNYIQVAYIDSLLIIIN